MLVWIVIAAFWAGLLLLILHDVTKDAAGSSAVSIASRNAALAAAKGWRRLRRLGRRYATSLKAKPGATPETDHKAILQTEPQTESQVESKAKTKATLESDPLEATAQAILATVSPQATEPSKKTWWRRDQRVQISPAELEHTITEAIRKAAPECGGFVGVIVHHRKPKQYRDPNWGVRGVKFGKADRRIVEETLARIVKQLQKEFRLADSQLRN